MEMQAMGNCISNQEIAFFVLLQPPQMYTIYPLQSLYPEFHQIYSVLPV